MYTVAWTHSLHIQLVKLGKKICTQYTAASGRIESPGKTLVGFLEPRLIELQGLAGSSSM